MSNKGVQTTTVKIRERVLATITYGSQVFELNKPGDQMIVHFKRTMEDGVTALGKEYTLLVALDLKDKAHWTRLTRREIKQRRDTVRRLFLLEKIVKQQRRDIAALKRKGK